MRKSYVTRLSDRTCFSVQPAGIRIGKQRFQRVIDLLIEGIEPFGLSGIQHIADNGCGVDICAGQGLELQPLAEFVFAGRDAQNHILVTYPVEALAVNAGLVRCNHTGHKRLILQILTKSNILEYGCL